MRRLLLKPTLAITFVLAVCIGLIRAQPHDDAELRAFLSPPDGCPAPCWQGIQPGMTTVGEALTILQRHPWVADITVSGGTVSNLQFGAISWRWSGAQPFPARPLDGGHLGVVRRVVRSVSLQTSLVFGDIWLLLDAPEQGLFSYSQVEANMALPIYLINYSTGQFDVFLHVSCRSFWQQLATVSLPSVSLPPDSQSIAGMREASCIP